MSQRLFPALAKFHISLPPVNWIYSQIMLLWKFMTFVLMLLGSLSPTLAVFQLACSDEAGCLALAWAYGQPAKLHYLMLQWSTTSTNWLHNQGSKLALRPATMSATRRNYFSCLDGAHLFVFAAILGSHHTTPSPYADIPSATPKPDSLNHTSLVKYIFNLSHY